MNQQVHGFKFNLWVVLGLTATMGLSVFFFVSRWVRPMMDGAALSTVDVRSGEALSGNGKSPSHVELVGTENRKPTDAALPTVPTSLVSAANDSELTDGVDPQAAGWPSEAFSDETLKQLKSFIHAIQTNDADVAHQIASRDFASDPLRPKDLSLVFQDESTTVRRWRRTGQAGRDVPLTNDLTLFEEEFRSLPGTDAEPSPLALKNIDVRLTEPAWTRVRVSSFDNREDPAAEWTATWECTWDRSQDRPRLKSLALVEYEEVSVTSGNHPFLEDRTADVLGRAAGYADQLSFGMNHWVNRLEHRLRVNRLGHNGIAVGDINGDGRDDVYVCQPGGLPNRLYLQQTDGSVEEVARDANVDFLDDTTCALIIDLDNDGAQDLVLVTVAATVVLQNNGEGVFSVRSVIADCRNAFSLTAVDYDQDRLLDLYIGRYWATDAARGEHPLPIPYFDANNGGRNVLLRNQGDWQFKDVTDQVGLGEKNSRFTMAASWEDLDGDGDHDLYVANDFGRNCLYRNEGGVFHEIAAQAGVEDIASGMSVSFSDFNHDGRFDIYVSNMYSTAGQRTTVQNRYARRFARDDLSKLKRLARGNTLFQNEGDESFTDISLEANVHMGRWAWGSIFADVNNDSWDDLLVCNGFLTTSDAGDL